MKEITDESMNDSINVYRYVTYICYLYVTLFRLSSCHLWAFCARTRSWIQWFLMSTTDSRSETRIHTNWRMDKSASWKQRQGKKQGWMHGFLRSVVWECAGAGFLTINEKMNISVILQHTIRLTNTWHSNSEAFLIAISLIVHWPLIIRLWTQK